MTAAAIIFATLLLGGLLLIFVVDPASVGSEATDEVGCALMLAGLVGLLGCGVIQLIRWLL